jgi:hypothetical protein
MNSFMFTFFNGKYEYFYEYELNDLVDTDADIAYIDKKHIKIIIKGNKDLQLHFAKSKRGFDILLFNSKSSDTGQLILLDKEGRMVYTYNLETEIEKFVEDIFVLDQEEVLGKLKKLHTILRNISGATQDEMDSIRFANSKSAKKIDFLLPLTGK